MEAKLLMGVIILIIVNYRLVIAILLSPVVRVVSGIDRIPTKTNKSILRKLMNIIMYYIELFKDRLLLKWISEMPSHHVRNMFYRYIYLISMGKHVVIYHGAEIRSPKSLKIGRGSIIGDNAILDARAGIEIGEDVNFSSNVRIWTLQHDYRDPDFACNPNHYGPVKIGNRAWIGPHTIILHDVKIGEGAVVAAGAVVTKDVPPYSVVAGIPAKVIATRPNNLRYHFTGSYSHFL